MNSSNRLQRSFKVCPRRAAVRGGEGAVGPIYIDFRIVYHVMSWVDIGCCTCTITGLDFQPTDDYSSIPYQTPSLLTATHDLFN